MSNQERKISTFNMSRSTRSGGAWPSAKLHGGKVGPENFLLKENISRHDKILVKDKFYPSDPSSVVTTGHIIFM